MKRIINIFKTSLDKWKLLLSYRAFRVSLVVGLLVLIGSYVLTNFVSIYNDSISYTSVGDLILDNIPTYDLEFLFIWGIYAIVASIIFYVVVLRPEIAPFVMKTFGILFIVRCGFIVLIHVGPPEGFFYQANFLQSIDPIRSLVFKNDLFFSGHTSIPFMAFLLIQKGMFRWFMLAGSFLMGATVLLMHVHYSIDVFAAFFITHGIYSLSNKIFNNLNLKFTDRIKNAKFVKIQEKFSDYRERRRGKIYDKRQNRKKRLSLK